MARPRKLVVPTHTSFKQPQKDNVFVPSEKVNMSSYFDMKGDEIKPRKGLECGIISNGKLVNVVSDGYGHLSTQNFFPKVDEKLQEIGMAYETRSINREDCAFAVDYILTDPSYHINVKSGKDSIKPMLRFATSYVGGKALGYFGFWRKLCDNGLHVGTVDIGFSVRHSGNIIEVVIPHIDEIMKKFMDNQYYSLHKKFEVLAERPIADLKDFVKITANDLKIFKFEASDKNPEPSLNATIVLDTIRKEAKELGVEPNYWLGYNAFNELIGTKLKKTFEATRNIDGILFDHTYDLAMAQ